LYEISPVAEHKGMKHAPTIVVCQLQLSCRNCHILFLRHVY